jgi:hypothetical protein
MRLRRTTARTIPPRIRAMLAVGTGIRQYSRAELRDLWALYGDSLVAEFRARYGDREPYALIVGRSEGWIA